MFVRVCICMCVESLIYTYNSVRNILFGITKIYLKSVSYDIIVPTNRNGKKKGNIRVPYAQLLVTNF